jgi:FkbM family methyltransferase
VVRAADTWVETALATGVSSQSSRPTTTHDRGSTESIVSNGRSVLASATIARVSALSLLLPSGIDRFLDWRRRFERAGFSSWDALRAAGSRAQKRALVQSRIEQLPPRLRRELRCVVDVGANQGQWSLALLCVAQPARMELFEPNPEAFAVLSRALAGRPGLRLHPIALGAQAGELPLQVTAHSEFASFLTPALATPKYYGSESVTVQKHVRVAIDTLDHALADCPLVDLLKIDVQGFERQVLSGAAQTLARSRVLLIEANFVRHYQGDDSFGRLCGLLDELGFELWDLSPPFRAEDGQALWCDAVFVNRALSAEL